MNPVLAAVFTSPAAPFIALSAVVALVQAVRGKLAAKISGPAWWGLFAFVTTHMVTELWRLSDTLSVQVDLFSLGLFYVAALYAFLLRGHRLFALLIAVAPLIVALFAEDPAAIRLTWLLLAFIRVSYCALIYVKIPKTDLFARLIWLILITVHAVTVVEQIDCQIWPGASRPFEDGAACSFVWNPLLGMDFSYWLYVVYTIPLLWFCWRRWKTPA